MLFLAGITSPPNLTSAFKSGLSSSGGISTGNVAINNHGIPQSQAAFTLTAASTPSPVPSTLKLPFPARVSRKRSNYGSRSITFCAGSFNNR